MINRNSLIYGTVCTAWFPFLEAEDRKLRPVVVVSNNAFNELPFTYKQVVVALITSIEPPIITDFHILAEEGSKDFQDAGLLKTSYIRLDRIFCLDERAVNKIIGKFSDSFMAEISKRCKTIF